MKQERWTLQDAKNKFSAVVDAAARGKPQVVTKRGVEAVVVLSAAEYRKMERLKKTKEPSFTEVLLAIPKPKRDEDAGFERLPLKPRDVDF